MTRRSTALLTGATGFIGRHLARHLAAQNCAVVSLQRAPRNLAGVAETIVVPDLTPAAMAAALRGRRFDRVFHLAGYGVAPGDRDPESMFRINVELTRGVVAQAAGWGAKAVVIAGSGAEYDFSGVQQPVSEQHPLEAFRLYGASKAAGSLCALATARHLGVPLAVARLFGVFGPGEAPHRLLPSLLTGLRRRQRVPLSAGLQRRDQLYVGDAVAALLAVAQAIERTPQQLAVNVSSGAPLPVRAFVEQVAVALGASPALLGFGDLPTRPDDVACFAGDPRRLFQLTGWTPAHSLAGGIEASLNDGLDAQAVWGRT